MDKLAAVAALALLSGCAIIDSTISVQHEHPTATARLTRQRQISLTTTRSNPEPRQGVKKNGYGSELASVYTDPKPEKLIRDALETELLQAGFTVGENSPGDVSVEIQNFFAEPEVGFFAGDVYAEVDAVVSVKFDNGTRLRRRFKGLGKVTTLVWSDGFFHDAMVQAVDNFLAKAVPEIVRVFDAGSM